MKHSPLSLAWIAILSVAHLASPDPSACPSHESSRNAGPRAFPDERYAVLPDGDEGAWRAGNPGQGFEAGFSAEGMRVVGSGPDGDPWGLGLRLVAWGREELVRPRAEGVVQTDGHRIEIRRGPLTEWYVNDERGIEQGFTIEEPYPASGGPARDPLRLVLAADEARAIDILPGGRTAVFRVAGSEIAVFYSGLRAWDSRDRELPARLAVEGTRLSILVEEAEASYPITIDPWVWTQQAKLLADDGAAGDYFGGSVAVDGDTLLVGAMLDEHLGVDSGSAYVFTRSGRGWVQQVKLLALDRSAGDEFGCRVALDGDTALVGARADDTSRGAAYVFVRSGTTWTEQAKLAAPNGIAHDKFGWSVSLDGDQALIGAFTDDDLGPESGTAFVFTRSGAVWSLQAKLTASDGAADDHFGYSTAIQGDTAVVGASMSSAPAWFSGAAYVFVMSGTSWIQQAKLTASDGDVNDMLGYSVSIDGETALVGASRDSEAAYNAGAAYVFVRSGTTWSQQAKLMASDATHQDMFGFGVFTSGDMALVGSPQDDDLASDAGAIYAFFRTGTTWTQRSKITASDGEYEDNFGRCIDFDGDVAVVSADFDDDLGGESGAAYVFRYEGAVAHAEHRNAGTNPSSYDVASLPVLGATYTGTVDLAGTTGHAFAVLVGYSSPMTFPLAGGQTLLVNIADPNGELLAQPPLAGPVATYDIPVPVDAALAGFEAFTQALHFGGVQPIALSNAQDLFLGS